MREAGWERRKFGEPTSRNEIDNWFVSGFQCCVGVCGVRGCVLTLMYMCVCAHSRVCVGRTWGVRDRYIRINHEVFSNYSLLLPSPVLQELK